MQVRLIPTNTLTSLALSRKKTSWRRLFVQLLTGSGLIAIALLLLFHAARAQNAPVDTDDEIRRCIQELRAGGEVYPADSDQVKFQGVRWAADPREFAICAARRALERVADISYDPKRVERIDSTIDKWRRAKVPDDELKYLQSIAPAVMFSWGGDYGDDKSGPEAYPSDGSYRLQGWGDFIANYIPITKNPYGREALFLANLQDKRASVLSALTEAAHGSTLPEFNNERQRIQKVPSSEGRPPNDNIIVRSSEQTGNDLADLQKAPWELVANRDYPDIPTSLSDPSSKLPSELSGDTQQRVVKSVAFGTSDDSESAAGFGKLNQILGIAPEGAPMAEVLVQKDVIDRALDRIANAVQNQLNTIGLANNFFGPSSGSLMNMFGPDNFSNSINNLFGDGGSLSPGGGGSGGGGGVPSTLNDVPSQTNPPQEACAQRTPLLTADEAKGTAVVLGLPVNTSTPWLIQYVAAQSVYGITGINVATQTTETLGTQHFSPPDSCLWTVATTSTSQEILAAFIQDVRDSSGTKLMLFIQSSYP